MEAAQPSTSPIGRYRRCASADGTKRVIPRGSTSSSSTRASHGQAPLAVPTVAVGGPISVSSRLFEDEPAKPKKHPWAWLIKKVFLVDVTDCPDCGGRMNWLEVCTERRDINRVLAAHGLAPRASPSVGWMPLEQMRFSF